VVLVEIEWWWWCQSLLGLSLHVCGAAVKTFKMAAKTKPQDVRSLMKERNKSKKKIDSPLARYSI
jgi:hypothetical protein